jgi:putative pyruvate formate lyase activating enzyme
MIKNEGISSFAELARKLTKREYDKVVNYAMSLGVKNAYIQDGDVALESFIPEFS